MFRGDGSLDCDLQGNSLGDFACFAFIIFRYVGYATSSSSSPVAKQIHSVYCNNLNRCADPSGMQYWSSHYATNGNMGMIVLNIVLSSEFETKNVMGSADVVNLLYQKCLARNADSGK